MHLACEFGHGINVGFYIVHTNELFFIFEESVHTVANSFFHGMSTEVVYALYTA
jgi:hypothetical protein